MLHFTTSGNGSENLVLLHGFMEDNSIWEDMEKFLSPSFTLIKIDLPGHGKSPTLGEIQTMEKMAGEVKKVLDHLKIENIHLLGHSMGGYVSLALAESHPSLLKSLSLFFSSTLADSFEKKDIRRRSIEVIQRDYKAFVKASIPNLFNSNELDVLSGKIQHAKKIAERNSIEGIKASQLGMAERPDRSFIFEKFQERILIIGGKHDNAIHTKTFFEHIPDQSNIKSYILDCGHNGHWEKPEICASILNTELLHHLPKKIIL